MTLEQMKKHLNGVYTIREEKNTTNAIQLKLDNGAVINVFNNGNYNVQGKNNAEVKEHINQCLGIEKEWIRTKRCLLFMGMMKKHVMNWKIF